MLLWIRKLQLLPEKAVTAAMAGIQSVKCRCLHTAADKGFMCIRLGQKTEVKRRLLLQKIQSFGKTHFEYCLTRKHHRSQFSRRMSWGLQQEGLEMEPQNLISAAFLSGPSWMKSSSSPVIPSCSNHTCQGRLHRILQSIIWVQILNTVCIYLSTDTLIDTNTVCFSGCCGYFPCVIMLSYGQKSRHPAETVTSKVRHHQLWAWDV